MAERRILRWLVAGGLAMGCLLVVAVLSSSLWLGPVLARQASSALGRPVTMKRLVVRLGSPLTVTADDISVGNPPEFNPDEEPLFRAAGLSLQLDPGAYLRRREIVVTSLQMDKPILRLISRPGNNANYSSNPGSGLLEHLAGAKFGAVRIREGRARVSLADLRAEFEVAIETADGSEFGPDAIKAVARGTYADQSMAASLMASGIESRVEPSAPWPFQLDLTNGPTRARVKGEVANPLNPLAANLDVAVSGPDLGLLTPLTGVQFSPTPPYELSGKLIYSEGRSHFDDVSGRVGRSDVKGTLTVTRGRDRPLLVADLSSNSADLRDIANLITGGPGTPGTPGQTSDQEERAEQVNRARKSNPRVLPDRPFDLSRLRRIDTKLSYRAENLHGPSTPFDELILRLEILDGVVTLRPLSFGIGRGRLTANLSLNPEPEEVMRARAEVRFEQVDLARLMQAAGGYQGRGALSGTALVTGVGRSIAEILGKGDGSLTLSMREGDLSKLLVDLAGLRLGSALLTSLAGKPRTRVECFLADLSLRRGALSTRTLLLETEDAVTQGRGVVDLGRERVHLRLSTQSKRLTIGVMPGPLVISGSLKDASAAPEGRGRGETGIADLLAALPTIELGVGDDARCERLARQAQRGSRR